LTFRPTIRSVAAAPSTTRSDWPRPSWRHVPGLLTRHASQGSPLMGANRFDAIAKALIAVASRRAALAAALSGSFVFLGFAHPDEVAAGGKCKPKCGECEKCKRGDCKKTPHGKKCRRGKCKPKDNGIACTAGTCQGGVCTAPAPDPNACTNNRCPASLGSGPCGATGSNCICTGPVEGSGVCTRDGSATPCPTGICNPGFQCISVCGSPFCLQPCV
jgi:hypothetical protein